MAYLSITNSDDSQSDSVDVNRPDPTDFAVSALTNRDLRSRLYAGNV